MVRLFFAFLFLSQTALAQTTVFEGLTEIKLDEKEQASLSTSIDGVNFKACAAESCVGEAFRSSLSRSTLIDNSSSADLADHINIFMGTNNLGPKFSRGNQHPGVHVPFGMNAFSISTKNPSNPWFYQYDEMTITGVKLTHQPSVWARDHASMVFLPSAGQVRQNFLSLKSPYSRKNEIARAYYYKNNLNNSGISFEFAPTNRALHFRLNYNKLQNRTFNVWSENFKALSIKKTGSHSAQGHVFNNGLKMYYFIETDAPIERVAKLSNNSVIAFKNGGSSNVEVKLGTSYISVAQARDNLTMEIGDNNFEQTKGFAKKAWNELLDRVKVEGATLEQRVTFYSTIYRLHAFPKTFWEHQGLDRSKNQYFSPYDQKVHEGKLWSGNGFWDTYRAVWPFFTILHPSLTGEMLDGWINSYRDGGWMVRWSNPGYWECMISTHSDIIFADAMMKGISFDHQLAYKASLKNALVAGGYEGKGRRFMEDYGFRGFVPWYGKRSDDEVGARTIEHAYNDFGLFQMSRKLSSKKMASYFKNRARSYQNLWDKNTRHYRAKKTSGQWRTSEAEFNPYSWRYAWTEGNSWHYRTPAPFDMKAMTKLYGSRQELESIVDEVLMASSDFDTGGYGREIHEMTEAKSIGDLGFGQFAIGNQPIQHMLHMYNFTNAPHKAQYWVKKSLNELFSSGFVDGHGYPGDEDNGQTSAWYAMNAIGFYSASPGIPEYSLSSGIFDRVTLKLENGKNFVFENIKSTNNDIYIESANLNERDYKKNYIDHEDIMKGGKISFKLSSEPSFFGAEPMEQGSFMPAGKNGLNYTNDLLKGKPVVINEASTKLLTDDSSETSLKIEAGVNLIELDLGAVKRPTVYTITNKAQQKMARASWSLYGSKDKAHWEKIDQRKKIEWQHPKETKVFEINSGSEFRHLRFNIEASKTLDLGELELYDL